MNAFLGSCLSLAWLAILADAWLGWQLLRQNGRLLLRLEDLEKRLDTLEFGEDEGPSGLPLGSEAPVFELPDLAGERTSLAQYRGKPVLLIFFNPACGFCRDLVPKLAALYGVRRQAQRDAALGSGGAGVYPRQSAVVAGALQNGSVSLPLLLVVSTGDAGSNRQLFNEHQLDCPVLLQTEMEVATAYRANGTPSGYLIDAEGKIASGLAIGADALLQLAEGKSEAANPKPDVAGNGNGREGRFGNHSLARSKIKRDGLKAGTPAPDFRLPRLDGRGELSLSEFRGQRVLLVFSSPNCGPCNALAPQLEKFHREHPELGVLMISKGEPKENRAKVEEHGLTFPVVLQQQWEISRRYAMFATPIAYLIDAQGIIIQDVAVGIDGIQSLFTKVQDLPEPMAPAMV